MHIERAKMADIPAVHKLINFFADKGDMLPRTLAELYETARDFYVAREDGRVVGCAALHINWADLAELRSVAVAETHHRRGIGKALAKASLEEARDLGIRTVYALTYKPDAFASYGFSRVDVATLPRKVWSECHRCPKFSCCDEIAMVCEVLPNPNAGRMLPMLAGAGQAR